MTTKPGAGAAAAALTSLERLSRDGVPLLEASREAECGVRSAERARKGRHPAPAPEAGHRHRHPEAWASGQRLLRIICVQQLAHLPASSPFFLPSFRLCGGCRHARAIRAVARGMLSEAAYYMLSCIVLYAALHPRLSCMRVRHVVLYCICIWLCLHPSESTRGRGGRLSASPCCL